MEIEVLGPGLSVCKVEDWSQVAFDEQLTFTGHTDAERSLVCPTASVPANATEREDGWRAFRIRGTLDFSLTGVLAPIATLLAGERIGIFAVSTFDTDYVLVKGADLERALDVLEGAGYVVLR